MLNKTFFVSFLLLVSCLGIHQQVDAFQSLHVTVKTNRLTPRRVVVLLDSSTPNNNNDNNNSDNSNTEEPLQQQAQAQGLILDAAQVQEHMGKLKSKYPTHEADYLAAARKRAQEKLASRNDDTTDDDWKRAAREKQQTVGLDGQDDWEASLKEAGNADSQILVPGNLFLTTTTTDGDGEEPKLLLY
jgi:hypothetical protein